MRYRWIFLVLSLALMGTPLVAEAEKTVPSQNPVLMIADTFRFVTGSWARYFVLDKTKNETSVMTIAVLEQEKKKKKGKQAVWIEIEMKMPGEPQVVTRFLSEETPQGPGEVLKAIVQVQGYTPFSVPKSFLKEDEEEGQMTRFQPAKLVRKLEQKTLQHLGRSFQAWVVEAETQDGETVSATVSEELPPIGVYQADTASARLTLDDWGLGATTRIQGTAIPFWLWIMEQVSKGLGETEPAKPSGQP